jgi:hypothetical protein
MLWMPAVTRRLGLREFTSTACDLSEPAGIVGAVVPRRVQGTIPGFDWVGLSRMRNLVARYYDKVNDDLAWQALAVRVPSVVREVDPYNTIHHRHPPEHTCCTTEARPTARHSCHLRGADTALTHFSGHVCPFVGRFVIRNRVSRGFSRSNPCGCVPNDRLRGPRPRPFGSSVVNHCSEPSINWTLPA